MKQILPKKKIILLVTFIISSLVSFVIIFQINFYENEIEILENSDFVFNLDYNPGGNKVYISGDEDAFLEYSYTEDLDEFGNFKYSWFEMNSKNFEIFENYKKSKNTIIILPVFTHSAYQHGGFYDFFREECDESCLTVNIERIQPPQYNSGKNAIQIFNLLELEFISDIQLHKNPEILKSYDKVILLHNEYVTKKEFDAITSHQNVIYLYPNALYGEIKYDEINDSISLIRGHGYPERSIDNGFNWIYDNTRPDEFDTDCENWQFKKISNGFQLNCYPEKIISKDMKLLKTILN